MDFGYARCLICGHIFERKQPTQKVCTQWPTRFSRDA